MSGDKQENRALREQLSQEPFVVGDKLFLFDLSQRTFIAALQKHEGDVERACVAAGKPIEWAQKFFSTRKFREFRNARLRAMAQRAGGLVDWWWEMGLAGARGFVEWWEGKCELCHEENKFTTTEIELFRQDDMSVKATCKCCMQPLVVEIHREAYKPSREQVQCWSEIGNRVSPKIERIQHEFSDEQFVFKTDDD